MFNSPWSLNLCYSCHVPEGQTRTRLVKTGGYATGKPSQRHGTALDSTGTTISLLKIVLWLILVFVRVKFPTLGFVKLIDLSLHVLDYLVLQGGQFSLPVEHALVAGQKHVESDQLPFGETFGLLDVGERIACEVLPAVGIDLAEFAIFALNHILTSIGIAGHHARGICGSAEPLTSALRSEFLFFCFTISLWYHTFGGLESSLR